MGPRLTTNLGILKMTGSRHPKEVEMQGGRRPPLAVATTAATAINAITPTRNARRRRRRRRRVVGARQHVKESSIHLKCVKY
jgi:hypothetical protein